MPQIRAKSAPNPRFPRFPAFPAPTPISRVAREMGLLNDRRGVDDGYAGASLVTGLALGLARPLAAVDLPLPALAAALAVVAGLAGLGGVDLAAVDLVDDARLGGMTLKSFLLLWACRTIKLVRN